MLEAWLGGISLGLGLRFESETKVKSCLIFKWLLKAPEAGTDL